MNQLPDPTPFFITVAQISFTITGLVLVVFASDGESRSRWYGRQSRAGYATLIFVSLVLPGFIAVGSLIATWPGGSVPAWPISAGVFGLFYLIVGLLAGRRFNAEVEYQELRRLASSVDHLTRQFAVDGLLFLAMAVFGWGAYGGSRSDVATSLPFFFDSMPVVTLFLGTLNVITLLREHERLRQQDAEQKPADPPGLPPGAVRRAPAAEAGPVKLPRWAGCLAVAITLIIGLVGNRGKR